MGRDPLGFTARAEEPPDRTVTKSSKVKVRVRDAVALGYLQKHQLSQPNRLILARQRQAGHFLIALTYKLLPTLWSKILD